MRSSITAWLEPTIGICALLVVVAAVVIAHTSESQEHAMNEPPECRIYRCRHCDHHHANPPLEATEPFAGGRAVVKRCESCHRIMSIRSPRPDTPLASDPDGVLTEQQRNRLDFTRWRLSPEIALTQHKYEMILYRPQRSPHA